MKRTALIIIAAITVVGGGSTKLEASGSSTIFKAIAKYFTKEAGQEAGEKAVKEVGEELVERTSARILREGGEQTIEEVSDLVVKHGPDVIRALDNAPSASQVVKSLQELPLDEVGAAASRLAAGETGKELATLSSRYGANVLRAEIKHPGIAQKYVRNLGADGADFCRNLTREQAIRIGKHVEDIGKLPPSSRSRLVDLASRKSEEFTAFVGRFVEDNPGKVLFTAATTTIVLANAESVLGGDEIVFDKDGNPTLVSKAGIFGRAGNLLERNLFEPAKEGISWLTKGVAVVIVGAVAVLALIMLYKAWHLQLAAQKVLPTSRVRGK